MLLLCRPVRTKHDHMLENLYFDRVTGFDPPSGVDQAIDTT